jgi:hypothetical protein
MKAVAMTDRTTAGIEPEPEEVEALLHNLCGFHLAERDPVSRYAVLTREQVLYEALAAAIKRERGRALKELVERGHRMTEVAHLTGLRSRQQVQRLIHIGTVVEQETGAQGVAEAQEASRQFEERLAAVEATLDEIVSGVPTINEAAVPASDLTDDDYDGLLTKESYVDGLTVEEEYAFANRAEPVDGDQPSSHGESRVDPAFDPLTGDLDELTGMLEPTQVMPALSAALQPTKELTADEAWLRRAEDVA